MKTEVRPSKALADSTNRVDVEKSSNNIRAMERLNLEKPENPRPVIKRVTVA